MNGPFLPSLLSNQHINQPSTTRGRCIHSQIHLCLACLVSFSKLFLESEIFCFSNSLHWNSIYTLKLVSNSTESLKTSLITKDRNSLFSSKSNNVFVCTMLIWCMLIYSIIFIYAFKVPSESGNFKSLEEGGIFSPPMEYTGMFLF